MQPPKSCLVLAPGGTDLSVLRTVLRSHNYRLVAPASAIPGRPWLAVLQESLRLVDLVVAVLPDTSSAVLNTAFELGVAVALGCPLLILADPQFDELPLALSGLPIVRAPATSREAVEWALDALTALPASTEEPPQRSGRALATSALEALQRVEAASSEREVLESLAKLFLDAGADVVSEAHVGRRSTDLAVWSDAMGSYLGNPLVVEVKLRLATREDIDTVLATLTNYVHASGAPWGLLLYKHSAHREYLVSQAQRAARILVLSFDELLSSAQGTPLFQVLRNLRNSKVHGIEP